MKIKNWKLNNLLKIVFPWKKLSKTNQRILMGTVLTVIIILTPLAIYSLTHLQKSEAAWFNDNWGYRQNIAITNSGSAQTDYQVAITLDTATLITNGKMQSNCNDIRITDINGKLLPFWIETGTTGAGGKACNASTTQIWTKVPSIPTSGQTIYLYYGNPQAQSTQNGNKVFEFFDDFSGSAIDSSKWTQGTVASATGTTFSESGGTLNGGDNNRYIQSANSFSGDYIAETRINTASPATNGFSTVGFYASSSNSFGILDHNGTSYYRNDSGWVNFTYNGSGQWNRDKVKIVGTNATYWRTGETSGSATATGITNSGISGKYLRLGSRYDDGAYDQNYSATWDWIIVRKTAATEPSVGSPTNEEAGTASILYLKFDEGTGTTAKDSSSNGFNGTITGATWRLSSDCISGNCLYFNGYGTGNKVDLGTSTKLDPSNFTVSTWIKTPDSSLVYNYIFSADRDCCGPNNGFSFYVQGGKLMGLIWNSTATGIVSNSNIPSNQWVYVTFSYDGSNMKLYINGILDKTVSYSGGVGSPASFNTSVGTMGFLQGTYTFKGYIDEFKLYSYARTISQIKADFSSRGSVKGVSTLIGASSANQNLSNGLVGYWKMDEATWSGTLNEVIDSSGNGNNGQAQGPTNNKAYPSAGKFGNAGQFDGIDNYLSLGNPLGISSTSRTLSVWINPTASQPTSTRLHVFGDSGTRIDYANGTGTSTYHAFVLLSSGSPNYVELSTSCNGTGVWHHLVLTADNLSGTAKLFCDGLVSSTATWNSSSQSLTASSTYGLGYLSGAGYFYGKVDEARIYNRALSPAEVSQLYNFAPGPVAYYNFEEGQGNTVNDISGNGNTGTWNGASWTQGKYGKGGNFTGGNYVQTSSFDVHNQITLSAWIKPSSISNGPDIVGLAGYSPTWGYSLNFSNSGALGLTFQDSGSNWHYTPGSSSVINNGNLNQWHYVSVTHDGTTTMYYFDGKLVGSVSDPYNAGASTNNLKIGYVGWHPFNGSIDEVKVYNYARTAKQIVSDMNANHPNVGSPIGSALGYWKFDEGYGITTNNSGNGGNALNGTLTGSPSWSQNGKFGKSLAFNNSNYVNLGNPSGLQMTSSLTISAWINTSVANTQQGVFSKWYNTSGNRGYRFYLSSSNNLGFDLSNDGTTFSASIGTSSNTITPNNWYYVTAVYNASGTTAKIYINGVEKSTTSSAPSSIFNTSQNANIATSDSGTTGSNDFQGLIDEVKVYNYALTADEIKLDMNHGASQVLGSMSNTSGLTGGNVASNSASAAYCIPGDTSTCNSPVGEWNFEEGNGNSVNDTSGNGLLGTMTNGAAWTSGKFGRAGNFNGASVRQGVQFSNNALLNPGTGSFTAEAWIKTYQTGSAKRIVTKRGSSATWYSMYVNNGKLTFETAVSYPTYYTTGSGNKTINDGQWHHVVMVRDTSQSKILLYVDGVLDVNPTDNTAGQSITNSEIFELGIWGSETYDTGSYTGKIDQVRMFNYARTPAQVAWDYNRGAPVGWWKFDECQGSVANDSSGNGNTGTITIGGGGTQTAVGTCTTAGTAWGNGAVGKFNSSLKFDATDDLVTANVNGLSSKYVSVSAWVKVNSFFNWNNFVNHNWVGNGWLIFATNANQIYFGVGQSGAQYYTPTNALNTGTWYHITGVYDGSNVKIYLNGQFVSQTSLSNATLDTAASSVTIGQASDSQIDDVRVYNYPLTLTQIKQIYNQGAGVRFGPLTGSP